MFKKDLMRLKYLLIAWFLLILAQSALGIGGNKIATEVFEFQMILPLLAKMISFLQALMMIVIVPLIIQDDSLVGTTAFWYTRPISRKGLLLAKSFMISIILVIPLLLAELFVLAANGATACQLLLAVPEVLTEKLAIIVPFAILATLTAKFSRYALVGIIIFAAFTIISIIMSVVPMFFNNLSKYIYDLDPYRNPSLLASVNFAKGLYIFLIGSALITHKFLTRRTEKTINYLLVAFLVMICFTRLWEWDFLQKECVTVPSSPAISNLSVDFDTQYLIISDEVRYRKTDTREKSISSKQRIKGLPAGQFTISMVMDSVQMQYPDGTTLKSEYLSSFTNEAFSSEKFMLPIQTALKDVKLLNPYKDNSSSTEIFCLDESSLFQFKDKKGIYSANANFDIYEYKIVSRIPLKLGSKDSFGSEQVVIYDILERPNVVSVIINEKKINLLFDRSVKKTSQFDMAQEIYASYSPVYLIVNEKRGEAFLPEVGNNLNTDAMEIFELRLKTKAKMFDFTNQNDRNAFIPEINKEWLADAELVRLDAVQVGTEKITFTIEDFSLPSQSTITENKLDKIDTQLRMQDKQLKQWYPE
ncbi:MAG TPA: hypothetical protein PLP05_04985 [Sedimentisphaerales bacterium]|nr:hypothetical protein [Sedimentisphaerales bacterium]